MRKLKSGDRVIVCTGRDKGKIGKILRMVGDSKVVVEGVNVARRHQRPIPARGVEGGIVEKNLPIHISNVAILNPQTNKADRVGIRVLEDGSRIRFYKSTQEAVDLK